MKSKRGFTLTELLVVIAILSLILAIAVPNYTRHLRNSKLLSYVEPTAKSCLADLATFCIENPGANISFSAVFSPNCTSTKVFPSQGTATYTGSNFSCNSEGVLVSGNITGRWRVGSSFYSEFVECSIVNEQPVCSLKR